MPETSEAFDAGVDWQSADDRSAVSVTVYYQEIQNLITFNAGTYFNIAEATSQGVEVSLEHRIFDWLSVTGTYAHINAEDGAGDPLVRVPEHSGDVIISVTPTGRWSGSVLLRYNGEETNVDGTRLSDWNRVDLSAQYQISDSTELYARVENVFDEQYQQVLGYGTPGRSASIGVRVRF